MNMMQAMFGQTSVELVRGDITQQQVDAIVNAANTSLRGGSGVDGAIHAAAGPQLLAETRLLDGCATGEAKITKGYRLPARFVIHAVGPVYRGGRQGEAELLAAAHRNSLLRADEHQLKQIAFPAISTGVYGYPVDLAATVALGEVKRYVTSEATGIELVRFVLWNDAAVEAFSRALNSLV